jgi:hypothetical protein
MTERLTDSWIGTDLDNHIGALKAAANAYGQGDNRRIVAIEEDLVNAIMATSQLADKPATDRVLCRLISYYILQIKTQWS